MPKTLSIIRKTLKEVDTVTVTNGKFVFNGTTPETLDPHYIFMENSRAYALVFIEDGTMEFTSHKDSLASGETVGTFQNDLFTEFKTSCMQPALLVHVDHYKRNCKLQVQ